MSVQVTDNSEAFKHAMGQQLETALEAIGQVAEGYAVANITEFPRVDTGRLRGSISHQVHEDTAYIGTNVEYAKYVELGTGPYAEGGRQDVPWFYKDASGKGHLSYGMKPAHFLKNAVASHKDEYTELAKKYLKG